MNSNTAIRASAWLRNLRLSRSSHSSVAKKTLTHRVIVAIANGSQRRTHSSLFAAKPEGNRDVLCSMIGVMDHFPGASLRHGHVKGIEHQPGTKMRGHGPSNNPAAEHVHHHSQIQKSCPGWDIGDVRHPQPVRSLGCEVTLDQVLRDEGPNISLRRADLFSATDAFKPSLTHQAGDTLAADANSLLNELCMHTRCTVGTARTLVNGPDALSELSIRFGPGRRLPVEPPIEPAGGDTQDTAHGGNRKHGLIRLHDFEDLGGIESVSRANQAAAFAKISRSRRMRRFSRRSRRSSSRSALVSPSRRRPSSLSAWATQFLMVCADGSNSLASSEGVRPARTSSTIRCRNSGGYGNLVLGMMNTSYARDKVSTKTGQLQSIFSSDIEHGDTSHRRSPQTMKKEKGLTSSKNAQVSTILYKGGP